MSQSDPSRRGLRRPAATVITYRVVGAFVIALLAWVVLGYLVMGLMGVIYGWGGHPAIPSAPIEVYFVVYLIALPIICLIAGWRTTRWIESRIESRMTGGESDGRSWPT